MSKKLPEKILVIGPARKPKEAQWADLGSMSEDFSLKGVLGELDRSETHLVVRMETRRWGKAVTVIQGLEETGRSIREIARGLKSRLATGGTVKDGVIVLQGDHRNRVKDELVRQGFPAGNIEVF